MKGGGGYPACPTTLGKWMEGTQMGGCPKEVVWSKQRFAFSSAESSLFAPKRRSCKGTLRRDCGLLPGATRFFFADSRECLTVRSGAGPLEQTVRTSGQIHSGSEVQSCWATELLGLERFFLFFFLGGVQELTGGLLACDRERVPGSGSVFRVPCCSQTCAERAAWDRGSEHTRKCHPAC